MILPISREEASENIALALILTMLTCGIYMLFWNAKQMRILNKLLSRPEFDFWKWFLLSIITCGIYHLYYQYCMGSALLEVHKKYQKQYPLMHELPLLSLLLTLFGLSIVVDAIHQHEIHKMFDLP